MVKLYFQLLEASTFGEQIAPALSASWQQRSFAPCRPLCAALGAGQQAEASGDLLFQQVVQGRLPFDHARWRCLAGLVFLYAAVELPQVLIPPETLCWLLAPQHQEEIPRHSFASIQQVLFGCRDLIFAGAYYRPDHAGFNDPQDMARLANFLEAVDTRQWTTAQLDGLPEIADEQTQADELAFIQEHFPDLVQTYRGAADRGLMLICERM